MSQTRDMLADAEHRYVLSLRMACAAQDEPRWREHLLRPEELYSPSAAAIVGAWCHLASESEFPIDADVALHLVRAGDRPHAMALADLVTNAPNDWDYLPGSLASCAALVRELGARNRREAVLEAANRAASDGHVIDLVDLRLKLEDADRSPGEGLPSYTQHKLIELGCEDWLRRLDSQGRPWHAQLGIAALDNAMGGIDRGGMVVIGARPSAGKSALLLRAARGASRAGLRTEILSLEDPPETWGQRELASAADLNATNLRRGGSMSHNEMARMQGVDTHEMWRVTDCRARRSLSQLVTHIRRSVREHSLDIVALDYIQLVKVKGAKERRLEVEEAAATLKSIAAETGVALLVASQLRRHEGPPTLDLLKEAGALEEQAEAVLLMHRTRNDADDEVLVEIAKNKGGRAGTVWRLGWDGRSASFLEATEAPEGWGRVAAKGRRSAAKLSQPGGYTRSTDPEDFRDE